MLQRLASQQIARAGNAGIRARTMAEVCNPTD
jgi:hypothetical protein